MSNGLGGGPPTFTPNSSNCPPWHGQWNRTPSDCMSVSASPAVQPKWVQMGDIIRKELSSGFFFIYNNTSISCSTLYSFNFATYMYFLRKFRLSNSLRLSYHVLYL